MLRLLAALGLCFALSGTALAQRTVCSNGTATFQGTTYACNNVDLLSRVSLEQMNAATGSTTWGWTDAETGREYAIMGLDNGTYFVDVTEPETPLMLGKLPRTPGTSSQIWREFKVYQDHAFIVADNVGPHGMQVFDLTQLRGLDASPTRTFTPTTTFFGTDPYTLGSAHNIAINEDSGYAYVVGARVQSGFSRVCNAGLYMVNIQNPAEPVFEGCFPGVGYIHDVQCVLYDGPHETYQGREICFASNGEIPVGTVNTLTVVDVTDKANPVTLSVTTYSNPGYAHQGWLTEDHRYFLFNDEFDERVYGNPTRTVLFDVQDLLAPEELGSAFHGTPSVAHNLYVRGHHSFHANYTSGLSVLDISPLLSQGRIDTISRVAHFDTFPQSNNLNFDGAWNVYPYFESGTILVSDINNGLFMLKAQFPLTDGPPTSPESSVKLEAFPNPFGNQLTVEVSLDTTQVVRVDVFDVLGRRVATLHDAPLPAGSTPLTLNTSELPSGVFVVRANGEAFTRTLRVTRTR